MYQRQTASPEVMRVFVVGSAKKIFFSRSTAAALENLLRMYVQRSLRARSLLCRREVGYVGSVHPERGHHAPLPRKVLTPIKSSKGSPRHWFRSKLLKLQPKQAKLTLGHFLFLTLALSQTKSSSSELKLPGKTLCESYSTPKTKQSKVMQTFPFRVFCTPSASQDTFKCPRCFTLHSHH